MNLKWKIVENADSNSCSDVTTADPIKYVVNKTAIKRRDREFADDYKTRRTLRTTGAEVG